MPPARKRCFACGGDKSVPNPEYGLASRPASYRSYNSYGELYREISAAYGGLGPNEPEYIQCEACRGDGWVEDYGEDDNG